MSQKTHRLKEIREATDQIQHWTRDGKEAYLKDSLKQAGVERKFEVIGEAITKLPDDLKDRHPDMPWHNAQRMRSILVHQYFKVDQEQVWSAVEKLPEFKERIMQIEREELERDLEVRGKEREESEKQREQQDKEKEEQRRREDEERAQQREKEDREREEERQREEKERDEQRRQEDDRRREEERRREDTELEEQRRREDQERDEQRKREDQEREEKQKRDQVELGRLLKMQLELEQLRNQKLEQEKEAPGSYGRSKLDDKIEAAEHSMDEVLDSVKGPDLDHAAPSDLERAQGADLDRAEGALDVGRDVEENWSLAQKVQEEERQIGELEQELSDLDREEPEREEREADALEQDQPGEAANPDDAPDAQESSVDWMIYGEEQSQQEQAMDNQATTGAVPEWEKEAYDRDVIERTNDLQLGDQNKQDSLTEQQIMQQQMQQQQLSEQTSLDETMRRHFLGEGKEREQGEKEHDSDDRGER